MNRKKARTGFTLLELIIVVIVIGILASIALPRYIRIAEKGRLSEAKSLLGALRSAQMRYAAQYSAYTTTIANLDTAFPAAKYFNYTLSAPGNLSDETVGLATATRNGADNPGLGSYVVNITMGGNLSGDAMGISLL